MRHATACGSIGQRPVAVGVGSSGDVRVAVATCIGVSTGTAAFSAVERYVSASTQNRALAALPPCGYATTCFLPPVSDKRPNSEKGIGGSWVQRGLFVIRPHAVDLAPCTLRPDGGKPTIVLDGPGDGVSHHA